MITEQLSSLAGNMVFMLAVIVGFGLSLLAAATSDMMKNATYKEGVWVLIASFLVAMTQGVAAGVHAWLGMFVTFIAGISLGYGLMKIAYAVFSETEAIVSGVS